CSMTLSRLDPLDRTHHEDPAGGAMRTFLSRPMPVLLTVWAASLALLLASPMTAAADGAGGIAASAPAAQGAVPVAAPAASSASGYAPTYLPREVQLTP